MKIAYLFHGHSRTWKDCYQSFFDNVYSVAPGDIYIHTWDRVNSKFGSHWNNGWKPLNEEQEKISSQKVDFLGLVNTYNPKDILVEPDRGLELALERHSELAHITATTAKARHYAS